MYWGKLKSAGAIVLAAALGSTGALAQDKPDGYPARPVTVVVPMGAGSGLDMTTRFITRKLEARLGQPFVVENRAGQAGGVGSASVARATPDGYTLLNAFLSSNVFNPIIYKRMSYKQSELRFVTLLYDTPFVLVVSAESGFKSVKDLVETLRKDPPKYSYASGGMGSAAHIAGAMFVRLAGLDGVVHVPYKTSPLIFPDLIANRVAFFVSSPDSVAPHVKAGKLRALLVAGTSRLKSMPDVPTAAEAGLPEMRASSWYVMQAPAGVPDAIVNRLAREVNEILKEPDSQAWFERAESVPMLGYTPESTTAFVEKERQRWEPHVRASGASVE